MNAAVDRSLQRMQFQVVAPLRRALGRLWQWWWGEIEPLLPAMMRAALAEREQRIILDCVHGGFTVSHTVAPLSGGLLQNNIALEECSPDIFGNAREVLLRLPSDRAIVRTIELPLAAEENLREVLSFEMDRRTPFTADQVYYDYIVTGRDARSRTLQLELVVAPRKTVDTLIAELAEWQIEPDAVTMQRAGDRAPLAINLLPSRARGRKALLLDRANTVLASVAALLLIAAIAIPIAQKRALLADLEPTLAAARAEAQSTIALRREVERLAEGSGYLVAKKRAGLKVVATLDEITQLLPDDTWTNQLEISSAGIKLQGQSMAAAALIPLLEGSPMLSNVAFQSPVVRAPSTGQERFQISATLNLELEQ